ncbi:unnamed protein product [Rotaria sordida]|uniref:TIR domain-containing protein n=1 Tax=Rotaria sordida TaxID=392033 RepID=A0A818XKG9_9BILA|nr:unnamed protein product [Rotaria sordida]CAF3741740.1 unnamed protein product [Rotaria sordida]
MASIKRSHPIWIQLRRYTRQFVVFIGFYLIQIYKFLRDASRDILHSRSKSVSVVPQREYTQLSTYANNETDTEIETQAQDSVEPPLTDRNENLQESIDTQYIPDVNIDSFVEIPIANGNTSIALVSITTVSSPSSAFNSPTASHPFITRNPMQIALSYNSETNDRIKEISQLIHDSLTTPDCPHPVFYAPNFEDELAVRNGDKVLERIYRRAALVVVFLSTNYHNSQFCYDEWRTIKSRFFVGCNDAEDERLLLVKLSDFNADELSIHPTDFYIDGTDKTDQRLAELIVRRWHKVAQLSK